MIICEEELGYINPSSPPVVMKNESEENNVNWKNVQVYTWCPIQERAVRPVSSLRSSTVSGIQHSLYGGGGSEGEG